LYDILFALYVDNILDRIEMQTEAYRKEDGIPPRLFTIYEKQKDELRALREKFGSVVNIDALS
jgi:phosphoenolpyruvate carboxykinase (GTP)